MAIMTKADYKPEFGDVPTATTEIMLELAARYAKDPDPRKVSLGAGTYRDERGNPWVLPSFARARQLLLDSDSYDHEYIPFSGCDRFIGHAQRLLLGETTNQHIASIQTVGGTGAVHLGAAFLKEFSDRPQTVFIPAQTWENHEACLKHVGLKTAKYRYWSAKTRTFDFDGMCEDLAHAPHRSIVILHACGHNPTGCDPTIEQWQYLRDIFIRKDLFAFFDCAYQGFVSGNLREDGQSIALFAGKTAMAVAQSFSKNAGLYGERVGALHFLCANQLVIDGVRGQLIRITRREISSCPKFGANLVSKVCEDDALFHGWMNDIQVMTTRINNMRRALVERLEELQTPGGWSSLLDQKGMFGFSGLSPGQCHLLETRHHVYCPPSGRLSIAGINTDNLDYVAGAIDDVARNPV